MDEKGSLSVLMPVLFASEAEDLIKAAKGYFKSPLEVILLHVIDPRVKDSLSLLGDNDVEKHFRELKTNTESSLNEISEKFQCQAMVVEGIPFLEITKVAKDLNVDVILMKIRSPHQSLKIETLFFGSTSERVIRTTSIPVFCLP
ncbi:MAG: universal stress protein [Leptospiraceae bacterium]|nr:universal stress protein [Leptospiraceae bacterium]MCP5496868.1 universal stress protein [Leptospiraceae bacterium]